MALVSSEMKAKFQSRIHAGLSRVFSAEVAQGKGYPPIVDPYWERLADAISDIAMDIVQEIHDNAQVIPGQQVLVPATSGPGMPSAGTVITEGKII